MILDWISFLVYPNLFGIKDFVVVVGKLEGEGGAMNSKVSFLQLKWSLQETPFMIENGSLHDFITPSEVLLHPPSFALSLLH
jgi:hypothetical protein